MIDFDLTEEQLAMQRAAREFTENEIKPIAAELDSDSEHKFNWDIIRKLAANDFLRMTTPVEYGGIGLDRRTTYFVIEEIASGCAGIAITVAVHNMHGADIIRDWGSEEQKRQYLPLLCDTRNPVLAAFTATEHDTGSDIVSMSSTAVKDGDDYILNGTKCFITNGGVAGVYLGFAYTDKSKGHKGISGFIIPADTPGVLVGKIEDKMGQRASQTSEVVYENVRLPRENLLSNEGDGFAIMMDSLNKGRPCITAAISVGLARAAFDAALNWAKTRIQFGHPIFSNQAISFQLVDMATMIETARLLSLKAAWLIDRGLPHIKESAMAKFYCSDMAMKVTTDALQVLGGYGYMKDFPMEKYMRDAKILQIYEGTNQIQHVVAAGRL